MGCGEAYSAVENRKKGEVLLKASACDARARAPISVLAMLSSTRRVEGRDDLKLCTMPAAAAAMIH